MNAPPKEFLTNADFWTALAGFSLTGLACLIAVTSFTKKRLNPRWAILGLAGVVAGITGTLLVAPHPNDVLVDTPGTQLLLSPFEGAETKALLEPGEKVRAKKSHGDFAYVTTTAGSSGWVEKANVSRYVGNWKNAAARQR